MALLFASLGTMGAIRYFATLDLHYLGPLTGGVLGLSATALFFLKWSDRWFREHADEELASKRYKADMVRASWIAELAQEWVVEGHEPPKELLHVFARNLFQDRAGHGDTEHPLDQMLGLLKRANKVDLSKGRIAIDAAPPADK